MMFNLRRRLFYTKGTKIDSKDVRGFPGFFKFSDPGNRSCSRLGNETLSRQVMPTRSYLSQSELTVTIGLGKTATFDDLEIIWPGGEKQKVTNARLDATTVVGQSR